MAACWATAAGALLIGIASAAALPSQTTVTTTPNGTVTSTATCVGTGTSYTMAVSATGIKSVPSGNIWQGGVVISNDVDTQYTDLVNTDANGDVTFPSFTYDTGGTSPVTLYVNSTTSSGGVDLAFGTDFPDCTTSTDSATPTVTLSTSTSAEPSETITTTEPCCDTVIASPSASSDPLANTGNHTTGLLGLSGLLLAVGSTLLFLTVRRPRAAHRR